MAKRVSVDKWLFTVTLLLVFVGLVMVFSASAVMAKERFGSPYGFLLRQMAWAAAGIVAMVVVMNIDYKQFRRPTVVFTFLGITSLLLIAVFFFRDSHNTHRWIKFGGLLVPAIRAGQARAHPLSRLLPGNAVAADHRLEECAASGSRSDLAVRAADREGARPGHGGRLRRRSRPQCCTSPA